MLFSFFLANPCVRPGDAPHQPSFSFFVAFLPHATCWQCDEKTCLPSPIQKSAHRTPRGGWESLHTPIKLALDPLHLPSSGSQPHRGQLARLRWSASPDCSQVLCLPYRSPFPPMYIHACCSGGLITLVYRRLHEHPRMQQTLRPLHMTFLNFSFMTAYLPPLHLRHPYLGHVTSLPPCG